MRIRSMFCAVATFVGVLVMASPATATSNPPVKIGGEVVVNTFSTNSQNYPEATRRPDKKWVVVWASNGQDSDGDGVYMQLYNADRTKNGGEVQVNTITIDHQRVPRVAAAADNSFVVTWQSQHAQSVYHVQSQRFSSSGAKVGGEFTVNTGSGTAQDADMAFLKNGDAVYCWQDQTSGRPRIMIRRYDATLSPQGGAVEVYPDGSARAQYSPRITALAGGGFVVVYSATGGVDTDIIGQVYTASATKLGQSFQVNYYPYNYQRLPHAAAFLDGGFIVTWDSNGQDGDSYGIVAATFTAGGSPIRGDFIVNTVTAGAQFQAQVATFSDQSFVITWYGPSQDGTDNVVIQYFDPSCEKIGPEILVNTHITGSQAFPAIASSWDDGEFGVFYASSGLVDATSNYDLGGQWFLANVPQVAPACTSACLQYFCPTDKILDIKVTGVLSNDVFGSAYFTDDSSVASAAVFAGLVAPGETGIVTVKCSGPKPSFTSASANGVTTQAFASPWPSSFTFDLGGETRSPPPPSPPTCYQEPCAHGKCHVQGTSFDITVTGVVSNNVWGTDEFSDDTWVGAAAVHQGILDAGAVGSVTVTCSGARTVLIGSSRNGVTSNSFGPWPFTYVIRAGPTAAPAPTADVCVGACLEGNCPENRTLFLRVYGTTWGYLWGGNAPYTGDSTVSAAAVHAGLVSIGETAIVKATCLGSKSSYTGSSQHGVTSASYGLWPESFELSPGSNMPTVTCAAGEQCLKDECTVKGRVIKVSVTGSTHSGTTFWGVALFTGDSPLSHAAVHDGLVTEGETSVLYATCQGPHNGFDGSTANGVTSSAFNAPWHGSFTLSAIR